MNRLLFPGSFDPVTRGHLDIIARASRLCDELVVAVLHNPDKRGALDVHTRVRLLERAVSGYENVRVAAHSGLLVDCVREMGATAVVRGVRPLGDFETEYQMARINFSLGGVETLLMTTCEECAGISSSVVRQIAAFGGKIDNLVPPGMGQEIALALGHRDDQGG